MTSMQKADFPLRRLAAVLLLSATLGGCVVYPEGDYEYYGSAVAVAPPAPIVETYGVAPAPGYFWVGGYWSWSGGRHVWERGHWEAPRSGYRWAPHRWVHERDGWHQSRGHWEARR
jgi:hypothetical protein